MSRPGWLPKWHWGSKDGGPESRVWMYGLECKAIGSVLVLRFENGTREAFHSHAFNAISWVLNKSGALVEKFLMGAVRVHNRERGTIITLRSHCHMVESIGTTWALSLRGPWQAQWLEVLPNGEQHALTAGRQRTFPKVATYNANDVEVFFGGQRLRDGRLP